MELNHPAIIVAAVSAFIVGGLWYSPVLFANAWMKANGFTETDLKDANMAKIFGTAFVLTLVMAYNLAFFINGVADPGEAIGYAVAAGLGWAALSLWVVSLFERRPFTYVAINGGYITVSFIVMGTIIALWK
jgi:hypothetical protein